MQLKNGTNVVSQTAYTHDNMSRLQTVSGNGVTATYARVPGSSMLKTTTLNNGTGNVMTVTKDYDNLNRLTSITSTAAATKSYTYQYNDRDQRIKCTLADGSYWVYKFDDLGQVTSGKSSWRTGQRSPGIALDFSGMISGTGSQRRSTEKHRRIAATT